MKNNVMFFFYQQLIIMALSLKKTNIIQHNQIFDALLDCRSKRQGQPCSLKQDQLFINEELDVPGLQGQSCPIDCPKTNQSLKIKISNQTSESVKMSAKIKLRKMADQCENDRMEKQSECLQPQ